MKRILYENKSHIKKILNAKNKAIAINSLKYQ